MLKVVDSYKLVLDVINTNLWETAFKDEMTKNFSPIQNKEDPYSEKYLSILPCYTYFH